MTTSPYVPGTQWRPGTRVRTGPLARRRAILPARTRLRRRNEFVAEGASGQQRRHRLHPLSLLGVDRVPIDPEVTTCPNKRADPGGAHVADSIRGDGSSAAFQYPAPRRRSGGNQWRGARAHES
ncbi:hypothetical protein GCM10027265_04950 [Jatrophihabitans fulvus]